MWGCRTKGKQFKLETTGLDIGRDVGRLRTSHTDAGRHRLGTSHTASAPQFVRAHVAAERGEGRGRGPSSCDFEICSFSPWGAPHVPERSRPLGLLGGSHGL